MIGQGSYRFASILYNMFYAGMKLAAIILLAVLVRGIGDSGWRREVRGRCRLRCAKYLDMNMEIAGFLQVGAHHSFDEDSFTCW
jgi:hypothetical protein